ncbi:hypothetical protein BH789_gp115 [Gordonia phage GMA6]|uniref:Uncharacterized protein n=1 Tax=Gordonia phage GMA6 TaxID=1647285 RepID=A0A0K0NKY2_9CAUD|nr:hypothetical protein BH789_gp115 [Gordonia phage GMA6]AKL88396.1 hypothetical protein GMA6_115 [Gordonia phage GMA6]
MCTTVMMPQSFAGLPPVRRVLLCGDYECTDFRTDSELADQFEREDHY